MEVFVLAGGYGTRLGMPNTPKPLVKINGKPLIEFALEKIAEIKGVKSVTVSVNAKFEDKFRKWLEERGHDVELLVEPHREDGKKFGSIGGIKHYIDRCYKGNDLLVAAGDNACDFSIKPLYEKTKKLRAPVLGLYKVKDVNVIVKRFGNAVLDENERITKIVEKPEVPLSPYVLTGFFTLPKEYIRKIHEYVVEGNNPDAFGYFFQWLVPREKVYGHVFEGVWFDVGTPESLKEAEEYFKDNYT